MSEQPNPAPAQNVPPQKPEMEERVNILERKLETYSEAARGSLKTVQIACQALGLIALLIVGWNTLRDYSEIPRQVSAAKAATASDLLQTITRRMEAATNTLHATLQTELTNAMESVEKNWLALAAVIWNDRANTALNGKDYAGAAFSYIGSITHALKLGEPYLVERILQAFTKHCVPKLTKNSLTDFKDPDEQKSIAEHLNTLLDHLKATNKLVNGVYTDEIGSLQAAIRDAEQRTQN